MTHNELRWAQSQSWWNDFTNIYKRTVFAAITFSDWVLLQDIERLALPLINDESLTETDNQILVRIANACLNHVEIPGLGEYSKPVVRTYKKEEKSSKKGFSYSSKKEEVAVVYLSNKVSEDEIQEIHSAIIERGIDFDEIKPSEKTIRYFKTTKVLKEI